MRRVRSGYWPIASTQANAGGLAVHEQSVYGQGTSFAGIAAGGALSSMYWNPATMTQFAGKGLEVGASAIFPYASNTPLPGSSLFGAPVVGGGTSDTGNDALVANGYFTYQFSPNLWLGMSLNSPFGLSAGLSGPLGGTRLRSKQQQAGDLQCGAKPGVSLQRLDQCRYRRANPICQGNAQ